MYKPKLSKKIYSVKFYDKSSYGKNWEELKLKCKKRDSYTCKKCGWSAQKHERHLLEAHHIIPLTKGGTNRLYNLITLCWKCHAKKHTHLRKDDDRKSRKSNFQSSQIEKGKQKERKR